VVIDETFCGRLSARSETAIPDWRSRCAGE